MTTDMRHKSEPERAALAVAYGVQQAVQQLAPIHPAMLVEALRVFADRTEQMLLLTGQKPFRPTPRRDEN